MSSIKAFGIIGTGGLGVLVAALIISKVMNLGLEGIFSVALAVFVVAGAAALILRAAKNRKSNLKFHGCPAIHSERDVDGLLPHPSPLQILLDLAYGVRLVVEYARCKTRTRAVDKRVIDVIHRPDAA